MFHIVNSPSICRADKHKQLTSSLQAVPRMVLTEEGEFSCRAATKSAANALSEGFLQGKAHELVVIT